MVKSKKLISKPIISLENGEQLGKVKALLLDPDEFTVKALIPDQKGLSKDPKLIPYENIEAVGEHAITVETSKNIIKASTEPRLVDLVKKNTGLIGSKTLTADGKVLGIVAEYCLDSETGRVLSLELSGSLAEKIFKGFASLPSSAVKTVGKDAIIVEKEAEEMLKRPETPLPETVKTVRTQSSKLWSSINKSWNRILQEDKQQPGDKPAEKD